MKQKNKLEIEEHKTKHEKKPLYLVVYATILEDKLRAISYHRVYKRGFEQIEQIKSVVNDFYIDSECYDNIRYVQNKKLYLSQLMKLTGLGHSVIKPIIIMMSSWKELRIRVKNNWVVKYDKPLLILQQQPKREQHINISKSPLYIYPYSDVFYKKDKDSANNYNDDLIFHQTHTEKLYYKEMANILRLGKLSELSEEQRNKYRSLRLRLNI